MITHTEKQGSTGWLKLRMSYFTASELSAAFGDSKYQSRNELLHQKKTGESKIIDSLTQSIFDRGHAAEAAIRPHIEKIIGEELFNTTGSIAIEGIKLLSSFDGLTLLNDVVFECPGLDHV